MRQPQGLIKLQSLSKIPPTEDGISDIKLSEATAVIVKNNNINLQVREQLKSLQEWILTQQTIFDNKN